MKKNLRTDMLRYQICFHDGKNLLKMQNNGKNGKAQFTYTPKHIQIYDGERILSGVRKDTYNL